MHPVTAHGFNFGLRGQDALARAIRSAWREGREFAAPSVLASYASEHRRTTHPLYLTTNALVALYTNDRAPARLLRKAMLHLGNHVHPARGFLLRRLTEHRA
jgi:2-polyprenyl-6-methoxyphenol hydroxylase-like FAD-dependent oxidoreductase